MDKLDKKWTKMDKWKTILVHIVHSCVSEQKNRQKKAFGWSDPKANHHTHMM